MRIQGREAVQMYVVKEVQRVYRNTGVYINDKHIEVIIRQMLRRVKVDEPGDTEMLPNDLVDRFVYADINARVLAEGGEPATAQTVLLGVRSEEHTSELQSQSNLVCRLLLEKKNETGNLQIAPREDTYHQPVRHI